MRRDHRARVITILVRWVAIFVWRVVLLRGVCGGDCVDGGVWRRGDNRAGVLVRDVGGYTGVGWRHRIQRGTRGRVVMIRRGVRRVLHCGVCWSSWFLCWANGRIISVNEWLLGWDLLYEQILQWFIRGCHVDLCWFRLQRVIRNLRAVGHFDLDVWFRLGRHRGEGASSC